METYLRLCSCCTLILCHLFLIAGEGRATPAPGPDGYGYFAGSTSYDWVDIRSTGTPVPFTALDQYKGPFAIGFPFSFYGTSYTNFYIQGHGLINFINVLITYSNQCPLPGSGSNEKFIAMMWDDLDPSSGGAVYYQSFGAGSCPYQGYGDACLVVQFQDVPNSFRPTTNTFEGILFEDNSIVIQFNNSTLPDHWGGSSTTGIKGAHSAVDHGLSYVCDTGGSLFDGLAVQFGTAIQVIELSPLRTRSITGCSGETVPLDYSLRNLNSASTIPFAMTYEVSSNNGHLTGPPTVSVADDSTQSFQVSLTPSGWIGDTVTATVTATGGGRVTVSDIAMTITTGTFQPIAEEPGNGRVAPVLAAYDNKIWSIIGETPAGPEIPPVRTYDPKTDTWTEVSGSAAPGETILRSGCQAAEKVYVFTEDEGLWTYNMATNSYNDLTALPGQPDPAVYDLSQGAWVSDDRTGFCYLTGGRLKAGDPVGTVFVLDPAGPQWLAPLPHFEHGRMYHAAWVVGSGTDKKLCVGGGLVDDSGVTTYEEWLARTTTTQCYSFSRATWNAENADLGPLPQPVAAMGYAERANCNSSEELWLIGGMNPAKEEGMKKSWYYDLQAGAWMVGPQLSQGSLFCGAVTLDNQLYKISGGADSGGSFAASGVSERLEMCRGCFSWPMFLPAINAAEKK